MRWVVLLLLASAAQAQPDPHRPTAEERRWLAACIGTDAADTTAAIHGRCAGRLTGACLGHDGAPDLAQPEGRNSHPRSCAPIEAALWDEWLNRWFGEVVQAAPAPAANSLRQAQRAWIAFRDAGCRAEAMLAAGFVGSDNAAACLLEQTARRALDLRRIRDDLPTDR
jgi:uncharacterized protein YecT (DUF1311 family)